MNSSWPTFREPFRATLMRTGAIAIFVGAVLAWRGDGPGLGWMARWGAATVLMLWPALGGHYVEVGFLNGVRPRVSRGRRAQIAARLIVWAVGGTILAMGMVLTAKALGNARPMRAISWQSALSLGGIGFIGIELVIHLALQLRGMPNFYDGRG